MLLQQICRVGEQKINEATDKVILPQSFLDAILREYTNTDLPSPLTFAVSAGSRKSHVGVREFSALEGEIIMPSMVCDNLAVKAGIQVSVKLVELEKGESVKLRPLTAEYDLNQDWKIALEGAFRSQVTTLTLGDVIRLSSGMRFLIDELLPANAVCIVDTDLEVVLEPMSEEQALTTVNTTEALKTSKMTTKLVLEEEHETQFRADQDFVLDEWDQSVPLTITLKCSSPDMCLAIGAKDESVNVRYNLWSDLRSKENKQVIIEAPSIPLGLRGLTLKVMSDEPGFFTIKASQQSAHGSVMSDDDAPVGPDEVRCTNCLVVVPKRSLVLHERHCLRNHRKCPHPGCTYVSKKDVPGNHWHCPDCSESGEGSLQLHETRFHTTQTCDCTRQFPDIPALARHRATFCPLKMHICQFCHLSVPQGDPNAVSYHDASTGLSLHESTCGSKTITCDSCGRPCLLKNLTVHQKLHDSQRKLHPLPRICRNENCVRGVGPGAGPRALCNACFGPLYSSAQDDDGSRLQSRIKRRYATQLMSGCRRSSCRNVYCASATGLKTTYADALRKVDEMSGDRAWFCVDEGTQRARVAAEMIECEGEYAIEWCCRALDWAGGDVSKARGWLSREAVMKNES
ncbi:Putative uncharacterized protein [Taphrina deformans PYCC 5710]|uniref:Uncharacterized protein n=1 Tax=Taphrina deformans (strain PYCC 5710 / ATCC 11124 / CBS 356.35 / IMI 108563 / JCM 9778 / NBRC 8474) TaxID=1097556 RepID=R4X809_TAPDE|nr:Putative uncharacterized protein [Taphrina deformans PYCC 5710]|eukprot:CCG81579.1 Putative uncharacterized protein [Taphrina deformans PYCC 5710]